MRIEPVLRVLDDLRAPYALVGGHALAARGYPRFTIDIDLLTSAAAALDSSAWTGLQGDGASVEVRRGDADDPLAGVVHILLADGTDVDVVVARWRWEADVIARAEPMDLGSGVRIPVPQAADLILLKLAAGGTLDLMDAAVLLSLDRERLIREVESRIADVRPDVLATWHQVVSARL